MSTVRIMPGVSNLEGRTVNGLNVGQMVGRRPSPTYETVCGRCGTKRVFAQSSLVNGAARCVADACGKTPTTFRSVHATTSVAMPSIRSRDTDSARMFRVEEEARRLEADQRQREEKDRAKAEQHTRQKGRHREFMREGIASGLDPFVIVDELFNDPTFTVPLPSDTAEEYHRSEVEKFRNACPDYYPCAENFKTMTDYLERNAPRLERVTAQHWEAVYKRLSEFGLLKERPIAQPAEPPKPKAAVNLTIAEDDGSETGWDAHTGMPLTLSRKQVAALSADEYRRFKRIYKDQLNGLPNVGPGPRARK